MSDADKRQRRRTPEKFESDLLMEKRRSLEAEVYFERNLLAELCRHFYNLGWFMGTGGSISVRVRANSLPPPGQQLLVMSPSGVQKERLVADDMFVLLPDGTEVLTPNTRPYPHKTLYSTGSAPLFLKVYELCNAGAIIHTHAMEACLVSRIDPLSKEFRISHMEMIKGIEGHWYEDELVVPIIENTDLEDELVHALTEAIKAYPKTRAVLIRNHGVYVWGDSWITAKTQAECYHYLFEAALKLRQLGLPCVASSQLQVPHRA